MRKKGLLVAMLALFSMGIIGLGACTTPNSDSSSGLIEEQTTFISGFDSYEELVSFRWRNHFGAAELTTEYCTEGNYAAKLTVRGYFKAYDFYADWY